MQKLQESVFSIIKTTNLSPAVFSFLQPSEDFTDQTPLGGILNDTRHGWLALGPKFCVVDLRTGLKVAAKIFGTPHSNSKTFIASVTELPVPLTSNSKQLIISLSEDHTSSIYVFHINGSQILRCIQTDVVMTELAVCDEMHDGPFTCFDGVILAGTKTGEILAIDLNRAGLIQALKDISQGYEQFIQNENSPTTLKFLPLRSIEYIEEQRDLALDNNNHLAIQFNENSFIDGQYIFRNPDGSVCMKAKKDQIRVTVLQYIPQLGSLAVGYNFGAFQIWNLLTIELEFTSQVSVECMPVTHFGFQEPCDDPRAFCYLWVVYSALDRFEEEEFPLAVMYSLTYHGKRMLSDTKCLYQEFSMASIRFQVELNAMENAGHLLGGRCVSCHTYTITSTLGNEGEDSMLNICQLVWECWGETESSCQYGMMLFDLDQWYKDQMPETYQLQSNAFMSASWCSELAGTRVLDARLEPMSVAPYSHATKLEEHFFPNSLQYRCVCLTTSEACVLSTVGIQRQLISSLDAAGPAALLCPHRLYHACLAAGLAPLYTYHYSRAVSQEEQRRFLLSVALEARLARFLKKCAHDWAPGTHAGVGCTLPFLVDWSWKRAIELKENAKELTAPLFSSSTMPDRNVVRCLDHCVQQLTQLTGLLDAVLTKCCNLVVPDALSEIEEKYRGVGTVSLYFRVVQWFLRVGLLPERLHTNGAVPYPAHHLYSTYNKRRLKLQRLSEGSVGEENPTKSCSLLYIDQLIENEFGGERIHDMWIRGGSECSGLYPPPSLYSLLRLYLLPDIPEEHKHSLVLYLLVDYSVVYDQVCYEAVIRRLMQFPTMFGLSNTAIKATQAFWHLDHRDFDFALDQLQCLTGNTLSEWQHRVVLSSLLAQKKTQAALQYLHVRKPAPIQSKGGNVGRVNDHNKLEDWQSCCNLYLARGLVFEALDVVRMCVQNAPNVEMKTQVLNFFFKGCRYNGLLSKLLQVSLLPLEEETFVQYLQNCNEAQTSDILVMYYLQQTRYIEAEQYNKKLKHFKTKSNIVGSVESLADVLERETARDTIVDLACKTLPSIANSVRDFVLSDKDIEPRVTVPKPLSVFIQANTPKNTFTYKSTFIQDTIENASETWINKPKMKRGMKRALNIEDTPFICTPKLIRHTSIFTDQPSEQTPPKRFKMDPNTSMKTPKMDSAVKLNDNLSKQMTTLLDMPEVESPECKLYIERSGAGTPHSILKIRRNEMERDVTSPTDSRYLADSDDDMLETASHYSDSAKHLRFTIPSASDSGSEPSPTSAAGAKEHVVREVEMGRKLFTPTDKKEDEDNRATTPAHSMEEHSPLESPPKKQATEALVKTRKSYKDTVRSRRTLSISANSSLSDDPSTSIESIADIPVTLINPRYSGERLHYRRHSRDREDSVTELHVQQAERDEIQDTSVVKPHMPAPKTPKGRRGIRAASEESTPLLNRSRSVTPERASSPIIHSRSSSKSPRASPLAPIIEQPKAELTTEPHAVKSILSVPRQLRSRSRTPDRIDKGAIESPKLEAISESPTKPTNTDVSSPSKRNLRGRSRTPERIDKIVMESPQLETVVESPRKSISTDISSPSKRNFRGRSRTPERIDKIVTESSQLETVVESPTKSTSTDISSPSKRSLRGRSRTPERIDKIVKESPQLETVVESPTKSTSTDNSSPSKRSLRSRSRTPEVEIPPEQPASPRSLRSRAKTPEKIMSPKSEHPNKSKKSLSRMVLEANTFAKSKMTLEHNVGDQQKDESNIECTPMKTIKQVSSLMDVTLSPIVNKSILQSSTDSILSETVEQDATQVVDKSITELGMKSLPAFTIHETYFEKSILQSYESSVAESSQSVVEEDSEIKTHDQNEGFKALPAFTTINESGFKSVLRSYDSSSVGDASQSIDKEKESKVSEVSELKTYTFTESIDTQMQKSVLKSCESSIAESSRDASRKDDNSALKNMSLITNDSDVEMKEDQEWKATIDSQEKASVIQKEKEKIVDIEREINELEGDLTDDDSNDDDSNDEESTSGDEEIVEALDSGNQSTEDNSDESETSESDNDDEEEIISIADTESKESLSSTDKQRDEDSSNQSSKQSSESKVEEINVDEPVKEPDPLEHKDDMELKDSLNHAQISMLTDDNSIEDQADIKLNYSDEMIDEIKITDKKKCDVNMETASEATSTEVNRQEAEQVTEVKDTLTEVMDVDSKIEIASALATEKEIIGQVVAEVMDVDSKIEIASALATDKEIIGQVVVEEPIQEEETSKPSKRGGRVKSTSSNKSTAESEDIGDPKTPSTRKRTQSDASTNDTKIEMKTPENEITTPRRRVKTPTSTEVRKIITRRVSKEIAEQLDESNQSIDDSVLATPKRRSARSRSKNFDDNESVASESSVKSTKSRASEDAGEVKPAPVRKGRKSILSTKPDLTVIPEIVAEEDSKSSESAISDYSSSRRLTRHQKSMLESSLDVRSRGVRGRRLSTNSEVSADDDASSTGSGLEGLPDVDETPTVSPEPATSDARPPRSRLGRAASETKMMPLKPKALRRTSVDVVESSPAASPVGSPARGRRASFNKACEALHTPKTRRSSTDTRKDTESPLESSSPEPELTPARRTRRATSTQSNTSQGQPDTGRRTKKTSTLDESKDSKKK